MSKEIPIALYKTEDNKFIKYVRYEDLKKYKEVLDKIKKYIKEKASGNLNILSANYILELLEEIE